MSYTRRLVINVGLAVLAVAVLVSAVATARETISLKRQERALTRELTVLVEKKQHLEEELGALHRAGTVERRAKEQLNLKYPGEEVVLVTTESLPQEQSATTTVLSWWKRLLRGIAP